MSPPNLQWSTLIIVWGLYLACSKGNILEHGNLKASVCRKFHNCASWLS